MNQEEAMPNKPDIAKQQSTAEEFTKDCAKKYIYHWNGCRWDEPCGKAFREACDRLDSEKAINKDLLEACEKARLYVPQCLTKILLKKMDAAIAIAKQ